MPAHPSITKTGTEGRPLSDATHRRILAGARRYFFAHGFRGVTMDDLADELGMSKKTLYAHFESKMALLKAVMCEKMGAVESDLERVLREAGGGFSERLQALLSCMRTHTEEIGAAYVRDVRREAPELFAEVQQRRRDLIQRFFGKLIQDGRRAGMIRKDISTVMMIEMLLGAVDAVVVPARMDELKTTPREAFIQIITIFLEGVLTDDGRKK